MKIKSLSAKNFRSLQDITVPLGRNYCTISGKNNAGKSALTRIIQFFLTNFDDEHDMMFEEFPLVFSRDVTQWGTADEISISIEIEMDRTNDAELFFALEKASEKIVKDNVTVKFFAKFFKDGKNSLSCSVNDAVYDDSQTTNFILRAFRSPSNLVTHNSTWPNRSFRYFGGKIMEVLETSFPETERQKIITAETALSKQVTKAARKNKDQLQSLLGRLVDKYEVDLSSIESGKFSKFPLAIKLSDRSVTAGLTDWGSGTQNRTRILTSFLKVMLRRDAITPELKATPVFLVEEPESFLHPSAQAEFGKILNDIAEESDIQIIATTHSPYMLNQHDPSSNILLDRRIERKLPRSTIIRDTSSDNWMLPFSETLGVVPQEFISWKGIFASISNKIIFVEGDTDKKYFEYFKKHYPLLYTIPEDVEIYPYGGSGTLSNNQLLSFIKNKVGNLFITYDLDVESEVRPSLEKIGLKENENFRAVGKASPGLKNIEGLLPTQIRSAVFSKNADLVSAALSDRKSTEAKKARSDLKRQCFLELERAELHASELTEFKRLFAGIGKVFV